MANYSCSIEYLSKLRQICDKKEIVLIFDECTSGFREEFGGYHKKYVVEPDMCMLGKALGNGYAITAVLGKSDVMRLAAESFISSTFWTEAVGPAAALETLKQMSSLESFNILPRIGLQVKIYGVKLQKNMKCLLRY